jgi:hypothetical protein
MRFQHINHVKGELPICCKQGNFDNHFFEVDELVPATGVDEYQLHHLLPLWNVDRLCACRVANQSFFLEVFLNVFNKLSQNQQNIFGIFSG